MPSVREPDQLGNTIFTTKVVANYSLSTETTNNAFSHGLKWHTILHRRKHCYCCCFVCWDFNIIIHLLKKTL